MRPIFPEQPAAPTDDPSDKSTTTNAERRGCRAPLKCSTKQQPGRLPSSLGLEIFTDLWPGWNLFDWAKCLPFAHYVSTHGNGDFGGMWVASSLMKSQSLGTPARVKTLQDVLLRKLGSKLLAEGAYGGVRPPPGRLSCLFDWAVIYWLLSFCRTEPRKPVPRVRCLQPRSGFPIF